MNTLSCLHTNSNLFKNILQVVKSSQRNSLRAHDAVRRREMKVKVWNRIFTYIPLSREAIIAKLGLHDDLDIFLAVDNIRVHVFQDFNCFGDSVLEMFECFFVVFKRGDVGAVEA